MIVEFERSRDSVILSTGWKKVADHFRTSSPCIVVITLTLLRQRKNEKITNNQSKQIEQNIKIVKHYLPLHKIQCKNSCLGDRPQWPYSWADLSTSSIISIDGLFNGILYSIIYNNIIKIINSDKQRTHLPLRFTAAVNRGFKIILDSGTVDNTNFQSNWHHRNKE